MPVELKILALGAVLLFVHIFVAIRFKTAQYGRDWHAATGADYTLHAVVVPGGRILEVYRLSGLLSVLGDPARHASLHVVRNTR